MTVKTPAPPPLPDELDALLRRLRMPCVRRAAPEVIATAASQRWEHAEVLRVLLAEEAAGRDQATIRMRRQASGWPAGKTFDAWDENASPIPKATQHALRTLEWVHRAEALCVCGPPALFHTALLAIVIGQTVQRGRRIHESLSPFRRPLTTWTACSSPRWTLCKTVWRATPSALAAWSSGR